MDLNEYIKSQGAFLKTDDVLGNPTAVWEITSEGEVITNKFGKQRLHLPVKKGDEERIFDCAKTNAQFIAQITNTAESKNWVGKHLVFGTYRTVTSDGKKTEAIEVKEVK